MQLTTCAQHLRQGVKPFLPTQTETGPTAAQLVAGCDNFISAGGACPYPDSMAQADRLAVSRNLEGLAQGAQEDFAASVPGGQLTIGQLEGAADKLGQATQADLASQKEAKHAAQSTYYHQVGKTIGWMGATAGSLVVAGMLPNPVSLLVVGGLATMTVRSINHSRQALQTLNTTLPPIAEKMKDDTAMIAELRGNAPYLEGWKTQLG